MDEAFQFAKTNFITERKKYPYRGKAQECRLKGTADEPEKEGRGWISKKFD